MAKQRETLFKERVQRVLKPIPDLWVLKTQMTAIRGIPDLLMCYRGKFIAWELKVPDNKGKANIASPLQSHVLEKISQSGGVARTVTPENLEEALKEDFQWQDSSKRSSVKKAPKP